MVHQQYGRLGALFGRLGDLDHLVVCVSGGEGGGPFASLDLARLRRAFAAKTFAQLEILQAALPHLGRTGSATLVTVASAQAALPSTAGLATYFARTAQRLPVGHIGQPADVAAAVALLIGNGFVTGHVLVADGGAHLAR